MPKRCRLAAARLTWLLCAGAACWPGLAFADAPQPPDARAGHPAAAASEAGEGRPSREPKEAQDYEQKFYEERLKVGELQVALTELRRQQAREDAIRLRQRSNASGPNTAPRQSPQQQDGGGLASAAKSALMLALGVLLGVLLRRRPFGD